MQMAGEGAQVGPSVLPFPGPEAGKQYAVTELGGGEATSSCGFCGSHVDVCRSHWDAAGSAQTLSALRP